MIIDVFIRIIRGILNVLLSPLSPISIGIDFFASSSIVVSVLQVIAYVFPWNALVPLVILTIAIFIFRIVIAIIHLILDIIPFT